MTQHQHVLPDLIETVNEQTDAAPNFRKFSSANVNPRPLQLCRPRKTLSKNKSVYEEKNPRRFSSISNFTLNLQELDIYNYNFYRKFKRLVFYIFIKIPKKIYYLLFRSVLVFIILALAFVVGGTVVGLVVVKPSRLF